MLITLKNLKLDVLIGLYESERDVPQRLVLTITIEIDGSRVGESDDVTDTVHYHEVVKDIIAQTKDTKFYLIERFAKYVGDIVMARDGVLWAEVEVDKPDAPIDEIDSVSVTWQSGR